MEVKMNEGLENIMEIENIKKEADKLMVDTISKYEKKIKELRESSNKQIDLLTNKQIEFIKENNELKEKVHNAETETALIKATGMNSPEMIAVKKEVCELRQDNRRLAHQVEERDKLDEMRKAGM